MRRKLPKLIRSERRRKDNGRGILRTCGKGNVVKEDLDAAGAQENLSLTVGALDLHDLLLRGTMIDEATLGHHQGDVALRRETTTALLHEGTSTPTSPEVDTETAMMTADARLLPLEDH